MGQHKALIEVEGDSAVRTVTRRLVEGGCASVVCVSPIHAPPEIRDLASVYDPGEGPVGAVLAALESSVSEWSFVIAVDHYGFESCDVGRLLESARSDTTRSDVSLATDGSRVQPLIAVWRTETCREKLRIAFDSGMRSFDGVLASMTANSVVFRPRSLLNINTPTDLLGFRQGLR